MCVAHNVDKEPAESEARGRLTLYTLRASLAIDGDTDKHRQTRRQTGKPRKFSNPSLSRWSLIDSN